VYRACGSDRGIPASESWTRKSTGFVATCPLKKCLSEEMTKGSTVRRKGVRPGIVAEKWCAKPDSAEAAS